MAIMRFQDLEIPANRKPPWLETNIQYEVVMGSHAYGLNTETSDFDVYGWVIPPKRYIFPHTEGKIVGYDNTDKFENYTLSKYEHKGKEYDFTFHGILKYFLLIEKNNPNIIDSLFVPKNCVLKATHAAQLVRENRKKYLHKGLWKPFKGYAYGERKSAQSKTRTGVRLQIIEKYGFDTKAYYNIVRILSECEQLLRECDLDLQDKGRKEHLKAIREGRISEEEINKWIDEAERRLENFYERSKLPEKPDKKRNKQIILKCLESHYGSLDKVIKQDPSLEAFVEDLETLISKYK